MTSPRNVSFDILANDKTRRATHSAANNFDQLSRKLSSFSASAGKNILGATRAVGSLAAGVAAAASMVGPATTGLIAAGHAVAALGHGLAVVAPAAATLPALAAGFLLVGSVAKAVGPSIAEALSPLTDKIKDLNVKLGNVAAKGVGKLADSFVKVNLPAIDRSMTSIAQSINNVVLATGKWVNSTSGQSAIRQITEATAESVRQLEAPLTRVVTAFGELVNRVGGGPIRTIASYLAQAADATARWLDALSKGDVDKAVAALAGWGYKVREVFIVLRDVGNWMAENQGKVKAFSDALATGAIALGAATGNIPAVLAGAFTLIVNHWDQVKETFRGAAPFFSSIWQGIRNDPHLAGIFDSMKQAWKGFVEAFRKQIDEIGPKFQELVAKLKAAWDEWGPVIKAWWEAVGKPALSALGATLGWLLIKFIEWQTNVAAGLAVAGAAFRTFVGVVLGVFGTIVNGAASAFGWMPGIGPKLERAAAEFNAYRDRVNAALQGIRDKDVNVNIIQRYTTQGVPVAPRGQAQAGLATGGTTPVRQPFWVGERGPELVWASRSAYVSTAQQSRAVASGGGGNGGGGRAALEMAAGGGGSVERMMAEVVYGLINSGHLRLQVAGNQVVAR